MGSGGFSLASTTMGPVTWKGRDGWHKTAGTTGLSWQSQLTDDWSSRKAPSTLGALKAKTQSNLHGSSCRTLSPLNKMSSTTGKLHRPASHCALPTSSRQRKKSPRQEACTDQGPDEFELGFRTSWRV